MTIEKDMFVHSRHAVFKLYTPVNGLKLDNISFKFM